MSKHRMSRRLIAFVGVVCITTYFSWVTYVAQTQDRIISDIRHNGGKVVFNDDPTSSGRSKLVRAIVRHLAMLPDEIQVDFRNLPVDKRLLRQISRLKGLQFLWLEGPGISDKDLAGLSDMSHLRRLSLVETSVTGEGLKYLRALSHLEQLDLMDSPVSDDGLKHVGVFRTLRVLDLSGTHVTDHGLAQLGQLSELSHLFLLGTDTTLDGRRCLERRLQGCVFVSFECTL